MVTYQNTTLGKAIQLSILRRGHLSWHRSGHTISQPIFSKEAESFSFLGEWAFLTGVPTHFYFLPRKQSKPELEGRSTVGATPGQVHGPRMVLTDSQNAPSQSQERSLLMERGRDGRPAKCMGYHSRPFKAPLLCWPDMNSFSLLFCKHFARDVNLSCPKRERVMEEEKNKTKHQSLPSS